MVPERTTDPVPVPAVEGTPVYTAAGDYFGEVVDLALDLDAERADALLVTDVDTDRFGPLPDGAEGVRVPYRYVRSIADVAVLNRSLDPDAVASPGDRGESRRDDSTDPADAVDAIE